MSEEPPEMRFLQALEAEVDHLSDGLYLQGCDVAKRLYEQRNQNSQMVHWLGALIQKLNQTQGRMEQLVRRSEQLRAKTESVMNERDQLRQQCMVLKGCRPAFRTMQLRSGKRVGGV